jgi:hypothetical protein
MARKNKTGGYLLAGLTSEIISLDIEELFRRSRTGRQCAVPF